MAAVHRQGQRHDRIPSPPENGDPNAPSGPGSTPRTVDGDISIPQKMLSAVSGSILTSLLGTLSTTRTLQKHVDVDKV